MRNTNGVIEDYTYITFKDMTAIHCPIYMFVCVVNWFKKKVMWSPGHFGTYTGSLVNSQASGCKKHYSQVPVRISVI